MVLIRVDEYASMFVLTYGILVSYYIYLSVYYILNVVMVSL